MTANTEFIESKKPKFSLPSWTRKDALRLAKDSPAEKLFFRSEYPDGPDGCWLWAGACSSGSLGYGHFFEKGTTEYAHRMAYEIFHGPIPECMNVLHHCDTPNCWNPDHLYLGTQQDNVDDAITRGRARPRLNRQQAEEVHRLNTEEGLDVSNIAQLMNLSELSVRKILAGKRYKRIGTVTTKEGSE